GYHDITKNNGNGGVKIEEQPDAGEHMAYMKWHKPLPMPPINILTAQQAFKYVLANAGATLPRRDAVDERVIKQVATGKVQINPNVILPDSQFKHRRMPIDSYKIGIITDINQVGGYPAYQGKPHQDADNEGIPDAWELKNGLNPKNPNDAAAIAKNGYSNIENYLNSLVSLQQVQPAAVRNK
ncbi:MAG TPA: polysaccharide lyase, partial [Phnomibacter sp.]|nr:polysaccharide lyase [Phnomibacter sp.]